NPLHYSRFGRDRTERQLPDDASSDSHRRRDHQYRSAFRSYHLQIRSPHCATTKSTGRSDHSSSRRYPGCPGIERRFATMGYTDQSAVGSTRSAIHRSRSGSHTDSLLSSAHALTNHEFNSERKTEPQQRKELL